MRKFFCVISLLLFLQPVMAETVSINYAGVEEIAKHLKGIGIKKAKAIIAYRKKHGAFTAAEQLLNVKGIGRKTLAANRDKISLGKPQARTEFTREGKGKKTTYIIGP